MHVRHHCAKHGGRHPTLAHGWVVRQFWEKYNRVYGFPHSLQNRGPGFCSKTVQLWPVVPFRRGIASPSEGLTRVASCKARPKHGIAWSSVLRCADSHLEAPKSLTC